MKVLRAVKRGEPDKYYDEKLLAQMDEDQGRKRISNAEVEMLIACKVCLHLLIQAQEDVLTPFAQYAGADRRLRTAITMLNNACQLMSDKVSGAQLITIANNANDATITLSAAPTAHQGWVNMPWRALSHIVNRALESCEMCCSCDYLQSKDCQLRKAYEQVPSMLPIAREAAKQDKRSCPYRRIVLDPEVAT